MWRRKKNSDKTGREREDARRSWRIRLAIVAGLVAISVLMIWDVSTSVRESMLESQMRTLDTVAARTTINMRNRFEKQWELIGIVEKNLRRNPYQTREEIFEMMDAQKNAVGLSGTNNFLFLIDEKGFYYSIHKGKIGLWRSANTVFSSNDLRREREISVNALAEMGGKLDDYLCFVKRMGQDLTAADGSRFTHSACRGQEVFRYRSVPCGLRKDYRHACDRQQGEKYQFADDVDRIGESLQSRSGARES